MSIGTTEALQSLRPTAKWSVSSGVVSWLDDSQTEPTTAELTTAELTSTEFTSTELSSSDIFFD